MHTFLRLKKKNVWQFFDDTFFIKISFKTNYYYTNLRKIESLCEYLENQLCDMITFQYVKLMHTNTLQTCNLTTQSLFFGAVLHSSTLFTQPTTKSTSQRPFRLTLLIACLAKQPAKATLTEKILTNIVTHTHTHIHKKFVCTRRQIDEPTRR